MNLLMNQQKYKREYATKCAKDIQTEMLQLITKLELDNKDISSTSYEVNGNGIYITLLYKNNKVEKFSLNDIVYKTEEDTFKTDKLNKILAITKLENFQKIEMALSNCDEDIHFDIFGPAFEKIIRK